MPTSIPCQCKPLESLSWEVIATVWELKSTFGPAGEKMEMDDNCLQPPRSLPRPAQVCAIHSQFLQTDQDQASHLFQPSGRSGFVKKLHKVWTIAHDVPILTKKQNKTKESYGTKEEFLPCFHSFCLKDGPLCLRLNVFP